MPRKPELSEVAANAIKAEIQTGRTFARIALDSVDPQKIARNAANARKAYDTAVSWIEESGKSSG